MNQAAIEKRIEIDSSIYNPLSKAHIRRPDPDWEVLLRDYPIAWHRDFRMWMVSSHALCDKLLRDTRFSPFMGEWEYAPPPKAEADKTDFDRAYECGLFAVTAKGHLRLRKLTMPAFSKRVMGQIDTKIRDLIVGCFDAIGDAREFDVYEALANKIPVRSIARMVGVPLEKEALFHEFAVNVIKATRINLSAQEREKALRGTQEGFDYFRREIAERRALDNPGDDFFGSLVGTESDGDKLSDAEILAMVFAVITAGSDTATDLHTYLIKALLSHPEEMAKLKANPDLMQNAVVECLRWGSFGKMPFFRFATEDIEFAGQMIRKGQGVGVNIQAAWHDPAKWKDPLKLDIERPLNGNIVFGAGPHFCLGTYLVHVQGSIMLEEFMRRYPHAELVDGDGKLGYEWDHHNARRINRLLVKTNSEAKRRAS